MAELQKLFKKKWNHFWHDEWKRFCVKQKIQLL